MEVELEVQDLKGKTNSLKTTSLDKKQVLVSKSYNLYPLTPCIYPREMQALALGSNLVLFLAKVDA